MTADARIVRHLDLAAADRPGPAPVGAPARPGVRWIVVAMVCGVALGALFPDRPGAPFRATELAVLSNVFLRLVKSLIAPLLFATLVVGIAGHGDDLRRVGRLAARSMLYFEVVTTLALGIGLVAVNVVRPGVGVDLRGAATDGVPAAVAPSVAGVVERAVPQSILDAGARNDVLQIVVFAILFAVGAAQAPAAARAAVVRLCEHLSAVMFRFTGLVMAIAPVGVGAAIAVAVGRGGVGVLRHLGALVVTLYGALAAFALVVLLPVAVVARVPLGRFWRAVKEPLLVAFSTSSSEAALPLALQNLERLGVPRRVAAFVLPAGYAFNMDGTSVYLALAAVFVAQAAGIDLPLPRQLAMLATLMLTSKGIAAVPRVSLVIHAGTLAQFGLPLEGVAVILGVDALMDMARTSMNLVGNCLAAVVMARWEGTLAVPGERGTA